jgi:hypothetical protein
MIQFCSTNHFQKQKRKSMKKKYFLIGLLVTMLGFTITGCYERREFEYRHYDRREHGHRDRDRHEHHDRDYHDHR